VKSFYHHTVYSIHRRANGRFVLELGRTAPETTVVAEHVLLATGRFLGKGLVAERQGIREALMDLPVCQPENRSHWHRKHFWIPRGMPSTLPESRWTISSGRSIRMVRRFTRTCMRPVPFGPPRLDPHQKRYRSGRGHGLWCNRCHVDGSIDDHGGYWFSTALRFKTKPADPGCPTAGKVIEI
jgi:hypothetical protein